MKFFIESIFMDKQVIDNKDFKSLLNLIKIKENLKQAEVADKLNVKNTYLSDMANGRVPVTDNIIKKIYENFHIDNIHDVNLGIQGNVINNSNVHQDNRKYFSDSPDVLRAQIEQLERLIEEKESRIAEKDKQIAEKDKQIAEKDKQIAALIHAISKQ